MGRLLIADASVIILNGRAGDLGLLQRTFSVLTVPEPVLAEVFEGGPGRPEIVAVRQAMRDGWMVKGSVDGQQIGALAERFPNLDLGELACLDTAIAKGEASVLLDDGPARHVARALGLTPVGSLGVVATAFKAGVLADQEAVAVVVRRLLQAGLWVSGEVLEAFWAALGGRP